MAIIVQPTELHQTVRTPETAATPSRRKSRWAYRGLTVLDVFLHVFVASTIVIGIWRASYQLYIAYYDYINPWFATGASVFVQLLLSVLSDPLVKYFKQKNHSKIAFWVVSRVYIYSRFVSGMFMYVCQEWLLELSLSEVHKVVPNEIVLLICIIILCLITKLASIMGPPTCGFEFDPKPEEIFQFDRMFWPETFDSEE